MDFIKLTNVERSFNESVAGVSNILGLLYFYTFKYSTVLEIYY